MAKRFAERLKKLREDQGLSQAELADKLQVSRGSISFYENSSRVPDIDVLLAICTYFSVSSDYMIGLSDDPKPKPTVTDELGLHYRAVDELVAWNTRYPDGKKGLSVISYLIAHSNLLPVLLEIHDLFSFIESGDYYEYGGGSSVVHVSKQLLQEVKEISCQIIPNYAYKGYIISHIKNSFGSEIQKLAAHKEHKILKERLKNEPKSEWTMAEATDEFWKDMGREPPKLNTDSGIED